MYPFGFSAQLGQLSVQSLRAYCLAFRAGRYTRCQSLLFPVSAGRGRTWSALGRQCVYPVLRNLPDFPGEVVGPGVGEVVGVDGDDFEAAGFVGGGFFKDAAVVVRVAGASVVFDVEAVVGQKKVGVPQAGFAVLGDGGGWFVVVLEAVAVEEVCDALFSRGFEGVGWRVAQDRFEIRGWFVGHDSEGEGLGA